MKAKKRAAAVVGVAEHGNSAELVTLSAADGVLLDRRRIDLTEDLPTQPYHHEGAWAVGRYKDSAWARDVTLEEAIELVQQVEAAAAKGAAAALENLAAALAIPIERSFLYVEPIYLRARQESATPSFGPPQTQPWRRPDTSAAIFESVQVTDGGSP